MKFRECWCSAVGILQLLLLLFYPLATVYSSLSDNNDEILFNQEFWEAHMAINVPSLKMLKRQLRNFKSDHSATVTLVFQATQPVSVRWFRTDKRLVNSEMPSMIPVEGDVDYAQSYMTSGQLTAATLTITQFDENFPQEFETILTTADGSKQFQIRTTVSQRTDFRIDDIDSPEWLITPPAELRFDDSRGRLDVKCVVFMPRDTGAFTNELIMYRATPSPLNPLKMDIATVVRIHKDTQNFAEQQLDATLFGRRHQTAAGHMIYQVGFTVRNATSSFDGIYQCSVERQSDRLIAISTVTSSVTSSSSSSSSASSSSASNRHKPLITGEPRVELVSCERDNYDKVRETLMLTEGSATCFRCRAIGRPRPTVSIHNGTAKTSSRAGRAGTGRLNSLRKGFNMEFTSLVSTDKDMSVNTYVNVADAGISEVTYTIHRTRAVVHGGHYTCMASNSVSTMRVQFNVIVRHKKSM